VVKSWEQAPGPRAEGDFDVDQVMQSPTQGGLPLDLGLSVARYNPFEVTNTLDNHLADRTTTGGRINDARTRFAEIEPA
jgi:hypothetical protein